jgi:hypothetical protein
LIEKPTGKQYRYKDTHDDAYKTLVRLSEKGEINRLGRLENNRYKQTVWSLSETEQLSPDRMAHELGLTDVYSWFWPFYPEEFQYWDWRWTEDEIREYHIHKRDTFVFDGRMKFRKVWFFFEYDRGSRSLAKLSAQIRSYYEFSLKYPRIRFHVIYLLDKAKHGIDYSESEKRAAMRTRRLFLLNEFAELERGHQFLVTDFHRLKADPKGAVLLSPVDAEKPISIVDITPL